jgi:uncharacterized protein YeaO (DUF488 family)
MLLHSTAYDPDRWQEFRRHYTAELQEHAEELQRIRRLAERLGERFRVVVRVGA